MIDELSVAFCENCNTVFEYVRPDDSLQMKVEVTKIAKAQKIESKNKKATQKDLFE